MIVVDLIFKVRGILLGLVHEVYIVSGQFSIVHFSQVLNLLFFVLSILIIEASLINKGTAVLSINLRGFLGFQRQHMT